ncbi:DUF447 domain-containing protein [Methanimicrococcus blatticola]|uniref:DUF447 family protein n=1 Tax=Methanimicrococcus blatticola TaxID=91560 RepID=A0A484F312_9EURY|nr:DUF447 domain-containing protein [Methanimicrococcus blatticola]MBZ3936020.1 DUF447 family protein [Methanimicrococcus blatticola]MCC2509367.1 DUF447 family protein [Methanimicrococcus blatticola]TDQ68250.1 hypothetical protein C7391_1189 [Methanimicrococcus blatticola]
MKETAKNLNRMAKFGISEGISEMILTTKNASDSNKTANAAPFGITWKNNRMFLHLFKGSTTYENLMREDYFAANMTDDAVLYAKSTFYDLEEEAFDIAAAIEDEENGEEQKTISVPVLKNADRFVLFKCVSRLEAADSVVIDIEPVDFFIFNSEKEGFIFNRGFHSVVEACIHLTRYELTKDPIYIDYIRHHQRIIQKCGRKRDKEGFLIVKKKLMELEIADHFE